MEIYLIEHGQFCQGQEIIGAFMKLSEALDFFEEIEEKEKGRDGYVVTAGLNEYDNTAGCLFGFWSGPARGNHNGDGWRVRILEVK